MSDRFIAGQFCPACGGQGVTVGVRDGTAIRICHGITLAWAWKSEEDYLDFYRLDKRYHESQQKAEGQETYWERDNDLICAAFLRLNLIRAIRPGIRTVMDIGAGTGAFVYAANRLGLFASGRDVNDRICGEAQKIGRNVEIGSWDVSCNYDLITLNDVFEHLTRPHACLEHLCKHLAPGGLLYIEMPETGCWQHLRDGMDWKHIRPKQHIAIYSDEAAKRMFGEAGLMVEFMVRPMRITLGKIAYGLIAE